MSILALCPIFTCWGILLSSAIPSLRFIFSCITAVMYHKPLPVGKPFWTTSIHETPWSRGRLRTGERGIASAGSLGPYVGEEGGDGR